METTLYDFASQVSDGWEKNAMKEISVTSISDVRIGQVETADAGTGCTVFLSEQGMRSDLDEH